MTETQKLNTDKMPVILIYPEETLADVNRKILLYGSEKNITDWPKHEKMMASLYARKRMAMAQLAVI